MDYLQKKLELEKQRQDVERQANLQMAFLSGQIALLDELLKLQVPEGQPRE